MAEMEEADDQNHRANLEKPRRRGAKPPERKRTNLRNYLKACIVNTPPAQGDNQTHISPIKIDGDGTILTHLHIKEHVQTTQWQHGIWGT